MHSLFSYQVDLHTLTTINLTNLHMSHAPPVATDATPSAPRNLMGFPMPTSLRLTWDAPLFIGTLTHYLVRCIGPQSLTNQTNGTERNFTFENLTPEQPYRCAVTAFANTTEGGMTIQSFSTTTPGVCALTPNHWTHH